MPRGQPKLALVERDDEDESSDEEEIDDVDGEVAADDIAGVSAGPSSTSTGTKQKGISLSLQKNNKDLVCHVSLEGNCGVSCPAMVGQALLAQQSFTRGRISWSRVHSFA
jgi:hypothetical protein